VLFDPDEEPEPVFQGNLMGRTTVYATRHYLGKGHTIVCDNRFTSANLFEHLFTHHKTYAVGSLRSNAAEMPANFDQLRKYAGNQRGDYTFRQNGRLLLTAWRDTTTVCLLSTNTDPEEKGGNVMRWFAGEKREIKCPQAGLSYTKSFNRVDMANHLISSFHVGRRCRSWHRYMFFHKLNQVCVNARINMMEVCGISNGNKRSQLNYRRALALQLLQRGRRAKVIRVIPTTTSAVHILERADRSRRCRVCYKYKQQRHESAWWCAPCKTNLCREHVRNCFKLHKDGVDKNF
jgi:Transposase IS4